MAASVPKQEVQKNAIYYDKTQHAKTTLKQQLNGEKRWKMRWRAKPLIISANQKQADISASFPSDCFKGSSIQTSASLERSSTQFSRILRHMELLFRVKGSGKPQMCRLGTQTLSNIIQCLWSGPIGIYGSSHRVLLNSRTSHDRFIAPRKLSIVSVILVNRMILCDLKELSFGG